MTEVPGWFPEVCWKRKLLPCQATIAVNLTDLSQKLTAGHRPLKSEGGSIVLWHHTPDNPNAVLRSDLKSFTFKVIFTETKLNCAATENQKQFDYSSVHQNSFHFTSRLPLD